MGSTNYYPRHEYDIHFKHPAAPTIPTHMIYIYISVSHDREPLTFPFLMFLNFGFSGRDLTFPFDTRIAQLEPMSFFYLV
jgi:hypothetical protein